MVVGIFTDTFFPEINGVATSVILLQRELEKLGHKAYVVTSSNPALRHEPDIARTFRLPSAPFLFLPERRMAMLYNKSVARKIRELELDIIHTNTEFSLGMFGKFSAAVLGIPVVHTYHTLYKDYVHYITKGKFPSFAEDMAKKFSYVYCESCDAVITPTNKTRDLLRTYEVDKPIHVIPTGIDFMQFAPSANDERATADLRHELGIPPQDKVILYVGRLAKEKNIDRVVRQLPKYMRARPHTTFLLVGDGPFRSDLQGIAREGGIEGKLVFAGERPWREIASFYKLGDAFVSASLSETQGLTFIEAMSAGLPVLAANDRSIEDLVINGYSGCLFDSDDEIPGLLERVLGDEDFRASLVRNALAVSWRYSAGTFARGVERVYRDTIDMARLMSEEDTRMLRRILSKKTLQQIIM